MLCFRERRVFLSDDVFSLLGLQSPLFFSFFFLGQFLSGSSPKRIFLEESSCLPKNAKKKDKKKGEEEGKQQHTQNARLKNTLKNGRYASTPARIVFLCVCRLFPRGLVLSRLVAFVRTTVDEEKRSTTLIND